MSIQVFDFPPNTTAKERLLIAMSQLAKQFTNNQSDWPADWEFTLWRFIREGQKSWQQCKPNNISRDDVVGIRRVLRLADGWWLKSRFLTLKEWQTIFNQRERDR